MRIALTSQNRKTITGHAGMCRNFLIYDIDAGKVSARHLVELAPEQTFHAYAGDHAHPLADVSILISQGMGAGLRDNLLRSGIQPIITTETDPEQAITALLAGQLDTGAGSTCDCSAGEHAHHGSQGDTHEGCGCH